eukprot:TRINITY_DN803_c0_g1_i3.p1 TRINITY_DN803_c0_g1~~TRINITY_DN803_c0_g1_i3.p1  ORF type:complete len:321 (+),score=57.17 TRINITY_DN803_c0_g1_i3:89-964(+)
MSQEDRDSLAVLRSLFPSQDPGVVADVLEEAGNDRQRAADFLAQMSGPGGVVGGTGGARLTSNSPAVRSARSSYEIPEANFGKSRLYEAKDSNGKWWPVTVQGASMRVGFYSVCVHDGSDKIWPVTHPANMRRIGGGRRGSGQHPPRQHSGRGSVQQPIPPAEYTPPQRAARREPPAAVVQQRPAPAAQSDQPPPAARSDPAPPRTDPPAPAPSGGPATPPGQLLCPITSDVMTDPYLTKYGHSFERAVLLEWVRDHQTCPITRQPLLETEMFPNRALREWAADWRAQHGA